MVVFGQNWFYTGRSGSFREKVVVFGQKWVDLGKRGSKRTKTGSIRIKVVV